MNKVIMIGNLTRDPEVNTTGTGVTYCRFSIAVNRNYTNASGEREVDFFNIITWRGLAETCGKYLAKGRKVAVSGRLETQTYEDKEGIRRNAFQIVAEEVEFLTPKSEATNQDLVSELKPVESDDLPF